MTRSETPTNGPAMVDAAVVAARTGQSKRAVLDQAARGALPHYRFGRNVRFDLDEVLVHGRHETSPASQPDADELDGEQLYQLLVA